MSHDELNVLKNKEENSLELDWVLIIQDELFLVSVFF